MINDLKFNYVLWRARVRGSQAPREKISMQMFELPELECTVGESDMEIPLLHGSCIR